MCALVRRPKHTQTHILEVSNEALDPAELEGLLGSVALELEAALQVPVSQVVHKRADDGCHQVLLCDQHPCLTRSRGQRSRVKGRGGGGSTHCT